MTAAAAFVAEEEKLPILYNQPSTTYRSNQPRSPPTTTTQQSMDDNIQYSDLQLHEEGEDEIYDYAEYNIYIYTYTPAWMASTTTMY